MESVHRRIIMFDNHNLDRLCSVGTLFFVRTLAIKTRLNAYVYGTDGYEYVRTVFAVMFMHSFSSLSPRLKITRSTDNELGVILELSTLWIV